MQKIAGLPNSEDDPLKIASLPGANSYIAATPRGRIFRTTDAGLNWANIAKANLEFQFDGSHDPSCYSGGQHSSCHVHEVWAEDDKHFFISNNEGTLFESRDGGKSWKFINSDFGSYVGVLSMTDPRHQPFYVATEEGVFQSLP